MLRRNSCSPLARAWATSSLTKPASTGVLDSFQGLGVVEFQ